MAALAFIAQAEYKVIFESQRLFRLLAQKAWRWPKNLCAGDTAKPHTSILGIRLVPFRLCSE
jgi:hypothetical protein